MRGYSRKDNPKLNFIEKCDGPCYWKPIPEFLASPDKWKWECVNCGNERSTRPKMCSPHITSRELEEMIDSSCRVADTVIEDNQSVYGELWLMRSALWVYWPYRIHCVYHIFQGAPFIMLFSYCINETEDWQPIPDTSSYRQLLTEADIARSQRNPKVTI